MADMTSQDMAGKLLAAGFERSGPAATALSDPIADTPMVVTLDQLRPYDHDPRMKRNPAYEEIKASIRERGLDAAIRSQTAEATNSGVTATPSLRLHDRETGKAILLQGPIEGDALLSAMDMLAAGDPAATPTSEMPADVVGDMPR